MKNIYQYRYFIILICLFISHIGYSQQAQELVNSIKSEVDRNLNELTMGNLKRPFYISYSLHDVNYFETRASNGVLVSKTKEHWRYTSPFLLVGSFEQNNKNDNFTEIYSSRTILENDPTGLARPIWSDLDGRYKAAAESFENKQAQLNVHSKTEEEKNLPDYLSSTPTHLILPEKKISWDENYWIDYVKKASEAMKEYPELIYSDISVDFRNAHIYYYNTEGTQYAIPDPHFRLRLDVSLITPEGHQLSDQFNIEHATIERLPDLDEYIQKCNAFAEEFVKLHGSKMIDESYIGPVLIEDMAVGEAVYSIFFGFGNSLVARRTNGTEGFLNRKLVSRSLSLQSISGLKTYGGKELEGYFPIDAEGVVPDKEFYLIEDGVLRNILNGRTPTKKIKKSNGHFRYSLFTRSAHIFPGNVLLTYDTPTPRSEMKQKLIEAAKEEDLDYTYIIRRMRGTTPTWLYKVNVEDGSEELIRGAFSDLKIRSFKRILAASDDNCFINLAPTGSITTVITPGSILFEEIELTKNNNIKLRTPFKVPAP